MSSAVLITISEIRTSTGEISSQLYTTDPGQEGHWRFDGIGTLPEDNTGTVLITADLKRFKRVFNGSINFKWFGAISDADVVNFTGTDNRSQLLNALSVASFLKVGLAISGKYAITPIVINNISNISIDFSTGSYIIGFNSLGVNDRLITIGGGANNITINAYNSYVKTPVFSSGEQRHNIQIVGGASDITINGLKCIGGGGDGFYIGSSSNPLPTNILLNNVSTDNARRNGISIVNGINVIVLNPLLENTRGTLPMAGIDIEPNNSTDEKLKGIRIINPTSRNNGTGILCAIRSYVEAKAKTLDVLIDNHLSEGDGRGFMIAGAGSAVPWSNKLNGEINYTGNIFNSETNGIYLVSIDAVLSAKSKIKAYIENPGELATSDSDRSGAAAYAAGGSTFAIGNFDLDLVVKDTRAIKKMFTGVYLQNTVQPIKNFNIKMDYDGNGTFPYGIFQSTSQNSFGTITFVNPPIYDQNGSLSATNSIRTSGGITNMLVSSEFHLPVSSNVLGQVFTIMSSINADVSIKLTTPDVNLIINNGKQSPITLKESGDFITVKASPEGWEVCTYFVSSFSETISGKKIFKGLSGFDIMRIQSHANLFSESAGLQFQSRASIGFDGILQSLKLSASDASKAIVFATALAEGQGEVARISGNGELAIGTQIPKSKIHVVGLVEYTDNASALSAGLTSGAFYRTGDVLKIVH